MVEKGWGKVVVVVGKLLITLKLCMIIKWALKPNLTLPQAVIVQQGLGAVHDEDYDSYNILNRRNVSFLLSPTTCMNKVPLLLLMVSSGPRNKINRDRWRKDVQGREGVRLVFLVAKAVTELDQDMLEEEHDEHDDIVQSSLEDGHRMLGYKILMGYVWTYTRCPQVQYTGKTDDNVVLDMDRLMDILSKRKKGEDKNFIACSVPSRNIATGRLARPNMRGNWSLTKEELEADILPDFCSGFLYVTTPMVGAALVQVGLMIYSKTEVVVTEDYLIAGVLRERLPGISLETLESGITASTWQHFFSHCPWLTTAKQTFFNDLVISKKSSRSGVQYVGHLFNLSVWRFFICIHMEALLEMVEMRMEGTVPDYIWDICVR